MGTKRSTHEELLRLGHESIFIDRAKVPNVLELIAQHKPNQIWLSHSNQLIAPNIKGAIKIPVVGFGFSDPYYFKPTRFSSYDVYMANHYDTFKKFKHMLPMHYNPTACDFKFHKIIDVKKDIDVSIIGRGLHGRFKNKSSRIDIFHRLLSLKNINIKVYGQNWGDAHPNISPRIYGDDFLNTINKSKLGLDLQDKHSPLAHRMFEYGACGTPVITRRRPEVFMHLVEDKEILAYDDYKELSEKIEYYINHEDKLKEIGEAAYKRCKKNHDIRYRVRDILKFLKDLKQS